MIQKLTKWALTGSLALVLCCQLPMRVLLDNALAENQYSLERVMYVMGRAEVFLEFLGAAAAW